MPDVRRFLTSAVLVLAVGGFGAAGAGCASTGQAVAPAPSAAGTPAGAVAADPAHQARVLDRVSVQVNQQTRHLPTPQFQTAVRARLAVQLRQAGFSPDQVHEILLRVDDARADRDRVSRWFSPADGKIDGRDRASR